jgi:hypothetical protein
MRKHFLIASFSAISAPARRGGQGPHLTHHYSRTEPFLFDTNKAHKIIILVRALLKTKEKQFSTPYKFAPRRIGTVSPVTGTKNVLNHRCHSNAACLAVPVVLTCPAASGPNWFAGPEWGLDGDETVEFDGTAGGISPLRGARRERRGIQPARGDSRIAVWRAVRRGFGLRGVARGLDGVGLHTHCGAFNQHSARIRAFHNSGK